MTQEEHSSNSILIPALFAILLPTITTLLILFSRNLLLMDYDHVLLGAIWTGVDVFFGLIFRFIFRDISRETRAIVARRILPATLFFLPTASILTPLVGYFLANNEGLWNLNNIIVDLVITIATLVVLTGFLTVFYQSLNIALSKGGLDDSMLLKRFAWISNGALLQAFLQIALISLMAYWVVFN